MVQELTPELLNIEQLFAADYLVPVYQRNYAWREEQIEQLIRDVRDAMTTQEDYFLGNLVVVQREGREIYEVIDGQQRLTTLYLLLTFLQEEGAQAQRFTAHGGRLQYESRARATQALHRVTQEHAAPDSRVPDSGKDADGGIYAGYAIIQRYFREDRGLNRQRGAFAEFLRSKVTVVRAALPPKTDLNRYFEIMNTRGQQLKQVDIVKARLMSRLGDQQKRACFARIWEACADMDAYVQMSLTRGDPKLRSRLFGSDWSWLQADGFAALMQELGLASQLQSGQHGSVGMRSIEQALEHYAVTDAQTDTANEASERFRSTLDFPVFLLHVLKVLHGDVEESEGALDDKRLIKAFDSALPQAGADAQQWVQHFAFMLLKCRNLFDAFIIKRQYIGTSADDGDWSLQRLSIGRSNTQSGPSYIHVFARAAEILEEDDNADIHTRDVLLLQSMLRITYTSPRTMHWITQVLSWLCGQAPQAVSHRELVELLRRYARNKVAQSFPLDVEPLPQEFAISRIVFTYLDFLLLSEGTKRDFKFQFRTSIEHFYPQHPVETQPAKKVTEEYLHYLGNLALVSVSANSRFGNLLPLAKVETFYETIVKQSPKLELMADIAKERNGWGDAEVEAHHQHMLSLLRRDLAGC